MRLPAEFETSATELPVELTALLAPPERRLLLPCATPARTSPVPVCDKCQSLIDVLFEKGCDGAYSVLTVDEVAS